MSGSGLRRNQVVQLLAELQRRMNARGLTADIKVVGGSALLLHGLIDRATEDIDAYYSHQEDVAEVVETMAMDHGLPKKWLNSSAAAFIPNNARWVAAPESALWAVKVADLPTMTAMKLAAERDKDIIDLGHLVNALGLRDASEVLKLAYDKYGEESIPLFQSRENYEIVAEEAMSAARRLKRNKNL